MAISASIFGAPWNRLLKPFTKNFWLTTMIAAARRSCSRPMATWFPSKNAGSGQPHIICPIVR